MRRYWLALALTGSVHAAPIQVLTLDANAKTAIQKIDANRYIKTLVALKTSIDQQVIKGLGALRNSTGSWEMKKFSIGLGATGEIGIGPWTVGKTLKQRFVYTR